MVRRKKHRNPMTSKSRNYSVLGVNGIIGGCKDIALIWSTFFRIEPVNYVLLKPPYSRYAQLDRTRK